MCWEGAGLPRLPAAAGVPAGFGFSAAALHGDLPQFQRTALMDSFKSGAMPLLVATDVAARGIHVDGLDLVVHCGVPLTGSGGARRTKAAASLVNVEQFLHRSGRTARMGAAGESLYNP